MGQVSGQQIFNRYPAGYQTVLPNIRPDIQSDLAKYLVGFKAYWPDIQQINQKSNLIYPANSCYYFLRIIWILVINLNDHVKFMIQDT